MTKPSPILIGVIDDIYTPGDSSVRNTIEAGIAEVTASGRLDRTVELVYENVRGLPYGTTHDVRTVYRQMVERGVVGILGPTVTDNTLTVRPLADSLQMPSLTWPGSEEVRSEYVFQYQAGSLEDEPYVLARNAAARGLNRVFVIHDEAATGRRYAEFFEDAARVEGLVQVARVGISAAADELPSVFFDRIEQSAPDAIIHFGMFGVRPLSLGLAARGWKTPVLCNIVASMAQNNFPEWLPDMEDWVYIDMVSDGNTTLQRLRAKLGTWAPRGTRLVTALDVGRLMGEGLARADNLDPEGLLHGLNRVKCLRSAAGKEGTVMGFGHQDRGALKGDYLVLRQYKGGGSVEWSDAGS